MIRFRDKQKDKAANANEPAKDSATDGAPSPADAKEPETVAAPPAKAEPAKNEDAKR